MTDNTTPAIGKPLRPQDTPREALHGGEVAKDATPRDLLRAPEGELRRFAMVKQPGKGPCPGLRPRFAREW